MIFENKEINYVFFSVIGINFHLRKFDKLGVCDEQTMSFIIDKVENEYNTSNFLVDFTGATFHDEQKVFELILNSPSLKDRNFVFYNIDNSLNKRLVINIGKSDFYQVTKEINSHYFDNEKYFTVLFGKNNIDADILINYIKQNDVSILNSVSKEYSEPTRLQSTPYWTNYYFDISKLFSYNPIRFIWLISRICQRIRELINRSEAILFYSTSLNGTVLIAFLKEILKDEYPISISYYDRLGPDFRLSEHNNISTLNKYTGIFISDFIIGGTELKLLKAMTSLKKLNIDFAISLGTFLKPEEYSTEETKVESLFVLENIQRKIYYSLDKTQLPNNL